MKRLIAFLLILILPGIASADIGVCHTNGRLEYSDQSSANAACTTFVQTAKDCNESTSLTPSCNSYYASEGLIIMQHATLYNLQVYNWEFVFPVDEPPPPNCTEGDVKYVSVPFTVDQMSQSIAAGQTYSMDGCEYTMPETSIQMCYETPEGAECSFKATATGQAGSGDSSPTPPSDAEPMPAAEDSTEYTNETSVENGSPEDGCVTGAVAETCISTQTEYTVKTLPDYMKWNPDTGTVELVEGGTSTITSETKTTTVTNNEDGSTTITTTVTETVNEVTSATTVIGGTGSATSGGDVTSSTSSTTTTQNYDGDGNLTGESTSETSDEEPSTGTPGNYDTNTFPVPTVEDIYETKYPDGIGAMIDGKFTEIKNTAFVNSVSDNFGINISGGSYPSWTFDFNLGPLGNFGTVDLAPDPWIWDVLGYIVLLTAAFTARALVFGG